MLPRFSIAETQFPLDPELERIVETALEGLQTGAPIEIDALAAAHPEYATELRDLLPMMASLLHLGSLSSAHTVASTATRRQVAPLAFQQLGDFRLIREIDRGGMGVVYEAEQLSMDRRVALKVLPFAALVDEKSLQRFRNEVRAAAALDHPNIVSVYSIGEDRGVHFYAMKLIRGRTLASSISNLKHSASPRLCQGSDTQHEQKSPAEPGASGAFDTQRGNTALDSRQWAERFRAAARIGIQAAEALQHAHDAGVLHRDIKPGNLLLDANGKVYVTDFGLARIEADAGLTVTGDVMGTIRYMPPEQALGKRVVIDHRADIYSLGATLYELVALLPAFEETDRSQLLGRIANDEPRPLTKLDRRIPVELETIVAKAMAKQPAERYQTAQQLADDLRLFLEDRPIRAKPPTVVQRATKWSRRHHTLVVVAGLALVLLSAMLAVSVVSVNDARREALALLDDTNDLLYAADMADACEAWEKGWADEARRILDRQLPQRDGADRRGFDWHLIHRRVTPPESISLVGHKGPVNELAMFPDGRRLASVGQDGTLRFWDTQSGRLLKTKRLRDVGLHSVAISPDGRFVAAGGEHQAAIVYLWDLPTDVMKEIFGAHHTIESLAFSHDGQNLAVGVRYDEVRLFSLAGDLINHVPCTSRVESLEFTKDNALWFPNRAADNEHTRVVQAWRDRLAAVEREFDCSEDGDASRSTVARLSPDEQFLAVGESARSRTKVFHIPSGEIVAQTPVARDRLTDVAYGPDGEQLAVGYANGTVELFDLQAAPDEALAIRQRPEVIDAHRGAVRSMRFVDAHTLATAGEDGQVKIWKLAGFADRVLHPDVRQLHAIQLAPDGTRLLCMGSGILILDVDSGSELARVDARSGSCLGWSPAGNKVAHCTLNSEYISVDDSQYKALFSITHGYPPNALAFSPDGKMIAVVSDKFLQVCDGDTGREQFRRSLHKGGVCAFHYDSSSLAYAGHFGKIVTFDLARMRTIREWDCDSNTSSLVFPPDGSLLATGHADAVIRLWDVRSGRLRFEFVGHERGVGDLAFSPDGRNLLSASDDGTIRLWSVEPNRGYGVVFRSEHSPCRLSLTPDGRRLAIGHHDDRGRPEVLMWDTDLPHAN